MSGGGDVKMKAATECALPWAAAW